MSVNNAISPPERAAATVLGLLLHRQPGRRSRQHEAIAPALPKAWAEVLAEGAEGKNPAPACSRLSTFQEQLGPISALASDQKSLLLELAERLIRADGQISLTEHLYWRMLRDTLRPLQNDQLAGPDALRAACTLLLSLTARAGQHEEQARAGAFRAGAAAAPMDGLGQMLGTADFSTRSVDEAMDTLAATTDGFRAALYRAVQIVARHDGQINRAEEELLATIGLALRLPEADTQIVAEPNPPAPPENAALELAATASNRLTLASRLTEETGWKQRDRVPAIALIAANLVPLLGVLFLAWDVRYLLLLYWLENLVIGAYTIVRMFSIGGIKAFGTSLFFTIHYGFFCAGHGMFVLALSSMADLGTEDAFDFDEGDIPFLIPFYMMRGVFQWIATHMPDLLFIPLLALIISHGISLVRHHFIGGEDQGRDVDDIMFDPYPRMAILHVSIIAGSFFVITSGGGTTAPVLIILIGAKLWLDLFLHRRAHAKRVEKQQAAAANNNLG